MNLPNAENMVTAAVQVALTSLFGQTTMTLVVLVATLFCTLRGAALLCFCLP